MKITERKLKGEEMAVKTKTESDTPAPGTTLRSRQKIISASFRLYQNQNLSKLTFFLTLKNS